MSVPVCVCRTSTASGRLIKHNGIARIPDVIQNILPLRAVPFPGENLETDTVLYLHSK